MSTLRKLLTNAFGSKAASRRYLRIATPFAAEVGSLEERQLLTVGADGWTVLQPSLDSRIVYVSSSQGADTNNGLTESTPVKTLTKAITLIRDDMPDWVLLKKGDTFAPGGTDSRYPGYIEWKKGGRSASEPMLLSSYGSGDRPVLRETLFFCHADNEYVGFSLDNLSFVGLDFRGEWDANPVLGNTNAIQFYGGQSNILIEDCVFTDYNTPLRFGAGTLPASGITIRRSAIYDNEKQGMYIAGADHVLLEENLWDLNGYEGGVASKFNHNIYAKGVNDLTVRGNIISRGSNFGVKLSADEPGTAVNFVIENNLFYDNGVGLDHSAGPTGDIMTTFTHQNGSVKNNVFTERVRTQALVGWLANSENVAWDSNLFIHNRSSSAGEALMWWGHHRNITVKDNIVHDWPNAGIDPLLRFAGTYIDGLTDVGNEVLLPGASYVDPSRDVGAYYNSIGGTNDAVAFITAVRDMSKANWNAAFTADPVDAYICAGFVRVFPQVSVGDAVVNESAGTVTFVVNLAEASLVSTSVNWTTVDGTAIDGSDFIANQGVLSFAAGVTTGSVTVALVNDAVYEGTESFTVDLSSPNGLVIADGSGVATINDDELPTLPGLSIDNVSVLEGHLVENRRSTIPQQTSMRFTVTLSAATSKAVSVKYAAKDATATLGGKDFKSSLGTLTFSAGQTSMTVVVKVFGDVIVESDEFFTLELSKPVNAAITDGTGTGTILNDDFAVFAWGTVRGTSRHVLKVEQIGVGVVIQQDNLTRARYTSKAPLASGQHRAWINAIGRKDKTAVIWSAVFEFTVAGVQSHDDHSLANLQLNRQPLDLMRTVGQPVVNEREELALRALTRESGRKKEFRSNYGIFTWGKFSLEDSATVGATGWPRQTRGDEALMSETEGDLIDTLMSDGNLMAVA